MPLFKHGLTEQKFIACWQYTPVKPVLQTQTNWVVPLILMNENILFKTDHN